MRDTKVKEIGPYQHILQVGDIQSMSFDEVSRGLFYVPDAEKKVWSTHWKTQDIREAKKRIVEWFEIKGVWIVSRHYTKEEFHHLTLANKVSLTFVEPVLVPGWFEYSKGLLQVLWEWG